MVQNSFSRGVRDGIPIALGYISVSFTFGMMAVSQGLPVWFAVAVSMTNLTSAGQFAGLSLIVSGASLLEMALTQLTINLRYALMSLSLTQKLDSSVTLADRFWISFGNTDEIFAVASGQNGPVGKKYFLGLMSTPYCGWALGTLLGAAAGNILPSPVRDALGIAIYGMFLAIIVPARAGKTAGARSCADCARAQLRVLLAPRFQPRFLRFCDYHLRAGGRRAWRMEISGGGRQGPGTG